MIVMMMVVMVMTVVMMIVVFRITAVAAAIAQPRGQLRFPRVGVDHAGLHERGGRGLAPGGIQKPRARVQPRDPRQKVGARLRQIGLGQHDPVCHGNLPFGLDPAADADDDSAYQSPAHYLEDHRYDPARQLEDADWSDSSTSSLHAALEGLDERSRDILQQRWLNEDKATLHDLAAKYNVSAERIRQLEKNAMNKLKGSIQA